MRGRLTALPVEKSRNATRIASMQSFIGNRRFTSSSVIMMVIAHLFRNALRALRNRVRFPKYGGPVLRFESAFRPGAAARACPFHVPGGGFRGFRRALSTQRHR